MTTTHERIAALEAELAAIKESLFSDAQPPALSPLDAMLQAYPGGWVVTTAPLVTCGGITLGGSCLDCDEKGHGPAFCRAIAAIPAMIAALRAVNTYWTIHYGTPEEAETHDDMDSAEVKGWLAVSAALTAAGGTP